MKKKAFTLAEVLITLAIIGIVAALTIPTIIAKYQKIVIRNQFKKTYSILQQTLLKLENDLEYRPACYYWSNNPYGPAKCETYNSNGDCTKWLLLDGSSMPSDYNGRFSECDTALMAFEKNLKISKKCLGNSIKNGCMPDYPGIDTIVKENDDSMNDEDANKATSDAPEWRKAKLKNKTSYLLSDGTVILIYNDTQRGIALLAVDVNGFKGPNTWGYDLFVFNTVGSASKPLRLRGDSSSIFITKGGTSATQMIIDMNK